MDNPRLPEFDAHSPIRPERFGHIVLRTARFAEMAPWYKTVLKAEPLYETPYGATPIAPELLERWSSGPIDPALKLPGPNDFIATDVALGDVPGDLGKPEQLPTEGGLELWHHQDVSFGVPEASVRVELFLQAPALRTR